MIGWPYRILSNLFNGIVFRLCYWLSKLGAILGPYTNVIYAALPRHGMKHCYVCYTRKFVYMYSPNPGRGPAHKVNWLAGCQNARTRAAADVSMEKNDKTSISKPHWYTKSKKELAGDVQLPRLSNRKGSVSWTLYVATRLTSSSHNSGIAI